MHKNGLLGSDILLSHANEISSEDLIHIEDFGAQLSSTPLSELQMGHGHPVCFLPRFLSIATVGTDFNSLCTSYIPNQLAVALLATRLRRMEEITQASSVKSTSPTVENAYNLGTVLGAQAVDLGDEIGTLAVGKKADIVVFHGHSPAMVSVAHRNPVAAIALHSSVRDIQTVIIDGIIRKEGLSLKKVYVPSSREHCHKSEEEELEELGWIDVVSALDQSRQKLDMVHGEQVDMEVVRSGLAGCLNEVMPHRRAA